MMNQVYLDEIKKNQGKHPWLNWRIFMSTLKVRQPLLNHLSRHPYTTAAGTTSGNAQATYDYPRTRA